MGIVSNLRLRGGGLQAIGLLVVYLIVYIGIHLFWLEPAVSKVVGQAYANSTPLRVLAVYFSHSSSASIPMNIWLFEVLLFIPFGFLGMLFLEDCYSFRHIGAAAFIFATMLMGFRSFFSDLWFDVDYYIAVLMGSFAGYLLALAFLRYVVAAPLNEYLKESPTSAKY